MHQREHWVEDMAHWRGRAIAALLAYSLHLMLYCLITCFQKIWWRWNDVQDHLDNIQTGADYEHSAQLLKVHHRSLAKFAIIHQRRHFITTHVRFVHPEFALQKHVTLMTVTDKEAIFCVASEAENVLNTTKHPFLFHALYQSAQYLLIMPISSMVTLADKVGDPKSKIIWVHSTGRCGSTAIAQVFNGLPNALALSEPHCLFSITQSFKSQHFGQGNFWRSSTAFKQIYISAVRLILKPAKRLAEVMLMKAPPMSLLSEAELLHECFPDFIQLFMYRDAAGQIYSLYNSLVGHDILADLTRFMAKNFNLHKFTTMCQPLGIMYNTCEDKKTVQWLMHPDQLYNMTFFEELAIGWAAHCSTYTRLMSQIDWKSELVAFKYEDLRANREQYLQAFFDYVKIELTEEVLSLVLSTLSEDSQKSSYVSRDAVSQRSADISEQMIQEANKYFNYFNLPLWGESLVLPNTVKIDQ